MKHRCDEYEDMIWERARDAGELPVDVVRHIESCTKCANALREARVIARRVVAAGEVPDTPDCREAVMARLLRQQRRLIPALGYACGVLAVTALVVGGIAFQRVGQPEDTELVTGRPVPKVTPEAHIQVENPPLTHPKSVTAKPTHKRAPLAAKRHFAMRPHGTVEKNDSEPIDIDRPPSAAPVTSQTPDSQLLPAIPRAIAAVVVRWPVASDAPSSSYSYMECNSETGETTKCSVKRSGDKVEIYIESIPGGDETPPVKGSIKDESQINA